MGKVKSVLARFRRAAAHDAVWANELGLPCAVCGAPSIGWEGADGIRNGIQVIEGMAVCATHMAESADESRSKAG